MMNPVQRILKNSTALSLSVLFERGVAFLLPWYIARIQGPEVWGHYSTALTFITISAPFAYWGLDQLLPREIARKRPQSGAFLANAGIVGGIASVLTTVILSAIVWFLKYPLHIQRLIWVGLVFILFPRTEAILCEATVNGLERMEWIAAVRFLITILRVASSFFLLSKGFGIKVLFYVLSVYYLSACGLYIMLLKRFIPSFHLRLDWSLARLLIFQAIPFVMTISIGETFKQIDRIFLSKLWNTDSVGIYSTGVMPVQVMYLVAPAIMNALFPVMSRAYLSSRESLSILVTKIFKFLLTGIFPIALTIIVFADMIILFVFGRDYTSSISVLRIYAIGIVPSFVGRLLYRTILASDNERLAVRVAFVNSIASLTLNMLLIPRYGVLGAAVSAACTELLGLTQNLFYVSRLGFRLNFNQSLLKPGLCILASVLLCLMIIRWSTLMAWVISLVGYIGMLFFSGVITKDDLYVIAGVPKRVGN